MGRSIFFIGAGASVLFGVPTMAEMVEQFESRLRSDYSPHLRLFEDIKRKLHDYPQFDLEALLRVLYDVIAADTRPPLNNPSVHYFSDWGASFERMTEYKEEQAHRDRPQAEALLTDVKKFLAEACALKNREFETYEALFQKVLLRENYDLKAAASQNTPNGTNCQVFTTNYGPAIEAFFDEKRLPYECGESQRRSLDIRSSNNGLYSFSDPRFQVYKLHGSVNWYVGEDGRYRWGTTAAESGSKTLLGDQILSELMICPASQKYTFLEPFYDMFHHLKQCLLRSEMCYVVGYSFRDEDILGLFHDALHLNDDLNLYLIDPAADNIVTTKFTVFERQIHRIPERFSVRSLIRLP